MAYAIEITPATLRDIKRLPPDIRKGVSLAIDRLATEPRPEGYDKIKGSDNCYRIHCGDYRILYQIFDESLLVVVVRARHRREVYKRISELLARLE